MTAIYYELTFIWDYLEFLLDEDDEPLDPPLHCEGGSLNEEAFFFGLNCDMGKLNGVTPVGSVASFFLVSVLPLVFVGGFGAIVY